MTVEVAWARGLRARSPVGVRCVRTAVAAALERGARAGTSLAIAFVDDAQIACLHAEWFGDPTPTDVISFELGDEGDGPAGELYVSLECALRVARERGVDPKREALLYVVHGTLHLCGFDDRTPRERTRMRRAEREVLARLGLRKQAHRRVSRAGQSARASLPPEDARRCAPRGGAARRRRPGVAAGPS